MDAAYAAVSRDSRDSQRWILPIRAPPWARNGPSLAAIDAGFKRAWGTIIDSHLTQLIAAVVLYFLGSGPVQGFAVTLALGILTSLFTSYTVTLYFVGLWFRWRRPKTLKIQVFRFIPDGTKIPFMKISHYAIVFSVII